MGLGFKDWAAGDVPTAAEFDGYLQRQTVMTFATTSARDTALVGNLDEGMIAYTENDDTYWWYTGSAWLRYSNKLTGFEVTRPAAQTIGAGSTTNISWTTEVYDSNGFITVTSPTATIPSGLDGVYAVTFEYNRAGGVGSIDELSTITVGGDSYYYNAGFNLTAGYSSGVYLAWTWTGHLSASDTIVASVTESSGTQSVDIRARLFAYLIGRT